MDIQKGDILTMKKNHPCGKSEANKMLVLRSGMDIKSVDAHAREIKEFTDKRMI